MKTRPSGRSRRGRRLRVLGLVVCALGACTSDRDAEGWTVVEEELANGARGVINTPPAGAPAPTLIAQEELRIGTRSIGGPESFGKVRQLAALPGGGVAVLDGMAEELRIFGPGGEHERTFGGSGAGPGELRGSQGVLLDPDGLLRVPEQGNARISYFNPNSGFVRSSPLYLYTTAGSGPWRAAMDSTGRTAVWSSGRYRRGNWIMIRLYDEEMAQIDSIPYYDYTNRSPANERGGVWGVTAPNRRQSGVPIPFYARQRFVIDPSGQMWTTPEGHPTLRVARWEPAGDTVLIIESARPPEPVTAADKDSAIAELERQLSSWPRLPNLDYDEIPPTKPPAYHLSLDDRNRLWVRVSNPDSDSTVYDVFDRDGRHAETVLVRGRVDPSIPPVLRGETLWTVVIDVFDVQYVVRARLRPPGPPTAA